MSFYVVIAACLLPISFHNSYILCMLCRFSFTVSFSFLTIIYPMVPCCSQAMIPVLIPPPETLPWDTSVVQKAGSVNSGYNQCFKKEAPPH